MLFSYRIHAKRNGGRDGWKEAAKAERCPFRSAWVRSGATKETSPFEGAAAAAEAAS